MECLHVHPARDRIKTASKFLFWFFLVFFGVIGAAFLHSMRQGGIEGPGHSLNPLEFFIALIGVGWFTLYAIIETLRLHRLSEHEGPLLTFSPEGVTDHFYLKRELNWEEINFTGCRELKKGRSHSRDYFRLEPFNRGAGYYLLKPFKTPMRYQVDRLNIPTADKARSSKAYTYKHINKYIREHAPIAYRKKSPPQWWTVAFWLVVGVLLIWDWAQRL